MSLLKDTVLSILLWIPLVSFSQPEWVASMGRSAQYPEALYITGFGVAKCDVSGDVGACLEQARATAKRNLAENIRISLQSTVVARSEEIQQSVSQYFSAVIQSASGLDVEGLWSDVYYETGEPLCYGFAYIQRDDLALSYSRRCELARSHLRELMQKGRDYDRRGEREQALKTFALCYPIFRTIEECESILLVAKGGSPRAVSQLDSSARADGATVHAVDNAIADLLKKQVSSFDDAAYRIAFLLGEQVGSTLRRVEVENFTYQDSRTASSFSRYFRQILETQLIKASRWQIQSQDGHSSNTSKDKGLIRGTYWEQDGGLRLLVSMYRDSTLEILAGANVFVSQTIFKKSGVTIKPQNIEQAKADLKAFDHHEAFPQGLSLKVWTNKGGSNPVFTRGDTMRVYIRLNVPSYIRFVYHLADGNRALLLDNFPMEESDVGRDYLIPSDFIPDAPFGAEVLQVFASTIPYERVNTATMQGYDIIAGDLDEFLASTRGRKTGDRPSMQAEQRVMLTTVDK